MARCVIKITLAAGASQLQVSLQRITGYIDQPAAEQFERSVKLDANYAAGWLALAELELVRGNVAVAEQRAETVLQMNPRNSRAMMVRASAQARRGKTADLHSVAWLCRLVV